MQLEFDFEPGHSENFDSLMGVAAHIVQSRVGTRQKELASKLDLSPSHLTRKMPGGDLNFSVDDLEHLIEVTGDYRPIWYLMERFGLVKVTNASEVLIDLGKTVKDLGTTLHLIQRQINTLAKVHKE